MTILEPIKVDDHPLAHRLRDQGIIWTEPTQDAVKQAVKAAMVNLFSVLPFRQHIFKRLRNKKAEITIVLRLKSPLRCNLNR